MATLAKPIPYEVRAIQDAEELRQARLLLREMHSERYPSEAEWLSHQLTNGPRYSPDHIRVAVRNDHIIGAVRLSSEILRIGESRLKMGGISWVAVEPKFREIGIAAAMVDNALQYFSEHGFHIAICFTRDEIFYRSSFVPVFEQRVTSIGCEAVNTSLITTPYRIRPIKPGDLPNVHRMRTRQENFALCTLLREYAHLANKWALIEPGYVVTDDDGLVQAFFLPHIHERRICIDECCVRDATQVATLMEYIEVFAREHSLDEIVFNLGDHHPLQHTLSTRTPDRKVYENVGGVRIVDLEETLESMVPEWESRINQSLLRELDEEVTLVIDTTPYRIRTHYGVVDIARQSGRNKFSVDQLGLTQLLCGAIPLVEIYTLAPRLITTMGKVMLETLLPQRHPSYSYLDRL